MTWGSLFVHQLLAVDGTLWRAPARPVDPRQSVVMPRNRWQDLADAQCGVLTRAQLAPLGVDRWAVRHRVRTGRWVEYSTRVIGTTTGVPTRRQLMWIGVLHAGRDAQVGHLTAAEVAGLRNWHREAITVLVPHGAGLGEGVEGIDFVRFRHPIGPWVRWNDSLPISRIEPAVLGFASRQGSPQTADGVLAAAVQQRLTTPKRLLDWLDRMAPLRGSSRFPGHDP